MKKQISVRGLADYMTAGPHRQRTILQQFKYPDEDEARAKILYYREARDRLRIFHASPHPVAWLTGQANLLEALAAESGGRTRTRLGHNARAIHAYAQNFGNRAFQLLDEVVLALTFGDVRITCVPELHVREDDQERLIKLDFGTRVADQTVIRIVAQTMFEASQQAEMGLPAKAIQYFDVARGTVHRGARIGARLRRDITAACEAISAIWDRL